MLRFRHDYTSLPPAPFLVVNAPAGAVPPAAAPPLRDCALGHQARMYTASEAPSGAALAWGGFSSFSTMVGFPSVNTRRWIDVATFPFNTGGSPYDSANNGAWSFFDPLDVGFDLFVVLRPAPGSAADRAAADALGEALG